MADSETFETACRVLERASDFDRLSARGTIRIVLKAAGLDPKSVGPEAMRVVVEKRLSAELEARGVSTPASACAQILTALERIEVSEDASSPEDVFARLGGEV